MLGYRNLAIVDGRYDRTKWHVKGTIIIKGSVSLGRGTCLAISETGTCVFGSDFVITGKSTIICRKYIEFGSESLVSWDVLFMDTDYHKILNQRGTLLNDNKPIIIGEKVWIGCRTLVLKGSTIPDGCIISAGSVIAGNYPNQNTIYTSNKKVLRSDILWIR